MRRDARGRREHGQAFCVRLGAPLVIAVIVALGASTTARAEPPPLALDPGFRVDIVADGLGAPRMLAFDASGMLLVSIPNQGRIVAVPARQPERRGSPLTVVEG